MPECKIPLINGLDVSRFKIALEFFSVHYHNMTKTLIPTTVNKMHVPLHSSRIPANAASNVKTRISVTKDTGRYSVINPFYVERFVQL